VKQRNRQLLEEMTVINELGEEFCLADLVEHSLNNPHVRRSELMARMAGFEPNPKYDGSTPIKAQIYLCKLWTRIRAKLDRLGICLYGMRVCEPQHDGTPHWHLLVFMQPEHAQTVRTVMRDYALQTDGDEPGAEKHRFTAVRIDWSRGSATGYIAKYISKNIDGHGMDADLYGNDAKTSAQRVEA